MTSFIPRWAQRSLVLIALVLLAALAADLVVLNQRVSRRLGGDPARAHTRFFSARLRIVPGLHVERAGLFERLARLDYRRDPDLAAPGTWRRSAAAVEIRLRAFEDADGALPERHARIALDGGRVRAIVDVPTGREHAYATVEPVALDAVWNGAWEMRRPVRLAELPTHVAQAVLAAEDARFYAHHGIDLRGIARALWVNVRERRLAEGASTITQQLARTFFLTPERTWRRKVQEALLAALLEVRLSKQEILELYLNEVYLGRQGAANVIGVGQGARTFFGKDARQLTTGEAATIAGIIPAPNRYSPLRAPDRARRRRNAVAQRMVRHGLLGAEQGAALKRAPSEPNAGAAPTLEAAFFLDQVRREVEARLGEDAVMEGRLDVYTTLDPFVQRQVERGLRDGVAALERAHRALRGRKEPLEAAHVALDVHDGGVRALVGGRDFALRPFDRAASARRQAGSTFKPFVFLAAFENHPDAITPSTLLDDRPFSLRVGGDVWQPVNYDERFRGAVTLRTALERSLNVPTVRLSQRVGVDAVARAAAAAGWRGDLPRVPSLALGAGDTTLLDLATAYTTFPRLGTPVVPYMVRGVVAPDATVLYRYLDERRPPEPAREATGPRVGFSLDTSVPGGADVSLEVRLPGATPTKGVHGADPQATYLVHHLLEGVVTRGTASALGQSGLDVPLAGKTGTTNDYRDAWFVGYTPDLVAATWVGFDDGRPLRLSSAASALPVWTAAMRPVLSALPAGRFRVPDGIVFRDVDPATGLLPMSACPRTVREAFLAGTEPTGYCVDRPGFRDFRRDLEEPFEAPVRVIREWLDEAVRIFGGAPPRRGRGPADGEDRDRSQGRRRYPAEEDERRFDDAFGRP